MWAYIKLIIEFIYRRASLINSIIMFNVNNIKRVTSLTCSNQELIITSLHWQSVSSSVRTDCSVVSSEDPLWLKNFIGLFLQSFTPTAAEHTSVHWWPVSSGFSNPNWQLMLFKSLTSIHTACMHIARVTGWEVTRINYIQKPKYYLIKNSDT